jgi:hypothetical protein
VLYERVKPTYFSSILRGVPFGGYGIMQIPTVSVSIPKTKKQKKNTSFQDSKIGIYQKMWRFMESKRPSVFVSTYEEGVKRVLDGNYAFLMESTMLDYAVQRDCNLTQIGGLLDSKGYGIATPKGEFQREMVNRNDSLGVVEMQDTATGT